MTAMRSITLLLLFPLLACSSAPPEEQPHDWGATRTWDAPPATPDCALDGEAALLDEVLAHAGLDRDTFAFLPPDWDNVPPFARAELDDPFVLSLHPQWRDNPLWSGCNVGELSAVVDGYTGSNHGLAGMVREASALLDRPSDDPPLNPATDGSADLEAAVEALCAVAGGSCSTSGELPEEAGWELVPVLDAIAHALQERYDRDGSLDWGDEAEDLRLRGGTNLLPHSEAGPDLDNEDFIAFLRATNANSRTYRAGARLVFALEHTDWSALAGLGGGSWELSTDAGLVRIGGASDDVYELEAGDEPEDILLLVDLGGDDVYRIPAGANTSAANAVSVLVDLGGDDWYGYDETSDSFDFLLPADEAGRFGPSTDFPNARQSMSLQGRQGAGLYGYGILFDLGGGSDTYRSLRMSQGYAHMGVGVLHDDGGDDSYSCEAACQGAGQWGIGILSDGGGSDTYDSIAFSMGFGYVHGIGFLVDAGGVDSYDCDHGHPDYGGTPGVYPSAQMPTTSNSSFCQGAGFGSRNNALSGGLGLLRDRLGDDSYSAGVFAQGTGYWQGTGILADGAGSDSYDAFWYVQGGAAHYALGMLVDDGEGNDGFNLLRNTVAVQMGAGHDFSTGVLINEAGDDSYAFGGLAMGASNCNGIGLVVDGGGDDSYSSTSSSGWGMGNMSGECIDTRPESRSMGIMIDAGGQDLYDAPGSVEGGFVQPANDSLWGYSQHGSAYEHGGGVDGTGEAGIHAGGS
jgi:hypothetical protein